MEQGDVDIHEKLFGYTINIDKGKPSNSEFIATLADRIMTEMGKYNKGGGRRKMENETMTLSDYIEDYKKNGTEFLINDGKVVGSIRKQGDLKRYIRNNIVHIVGTIDEDLSLRSEMLGKNVYQTKVRTRRFSGTDDVIPVVISEEDFDVTELWTNKKVVIDGSFQSSYVQDGDKVRLTLFIVANSMELAEESVRDENYISLNGWIHKNPVYRETPLQRKISDVFLVVNRPFGKSDYIPCICWGNNARLISRFEVGDYVSFEGRIQSREYSKRITETEFEKRTVYEVSVSLIKS